MMKITKLFVLVLGLAVAARANTVTWNLDSTAGFDVIVVGEGSSWGGNAFRFSLGATSGLWSVTGAEMIFDGDQIGTDWEWLSQGPAFASYLPTDLPTDVPPSARGSGFPDGQCLMDQSYSTYLGFLGDNFTATPFAGQQISKGWSLSSGFGLANYGWTGGYSNTITVVDPNDASTWTDTLHMWASGPDLGVAVPDGTATSGLVGLALIGLISLRRRLVVQAARRQ